MGRLKELVDEMREDGEEPYANSRDLERIKKW